MLATRRARQEISQARAMYQKESSTRTMVVYFHTRSTRLLSVSRPGVEFTTAKCLAWYKGGIVTASRMTASQSQRRGHCRGRAASSMSAAALRAALKAMT
jgi:hypothetical protein